MNTDFRIERIDLSPYLAADIHSPDTRLEALRRATSTVFGNVSIYCLSGGHLYCCPRPGRMVLLPFAELQSLKSRQVGESHSLFVGRALNYCVVLFERPAGEEVICFRIEIRMPGQFLAAIPSEEGKIGTISRISNTKVAQVFSCDGQFCTLLSNYPPLLPSPDLEYHDLIFNLPTPDGCLQLWSDHSGWVNLVCYLNNFDFKTRLPVAGPLIHLSLFNDFMGLLEIKKNPLPRENYATFISWSPGTPPQATFVLMPTEATSVTPIPNSQALLAMDLHVSGAVWIVDSSGYAQYSLQLEPPTADMYMLEQDPPAVSKISINDDGSTIIWTHGSQMQAVSKQFNRISWQNRLTTLNLDSPHGFPFPVFHLHSRGELRPVPYQPAPH